MLVKLGDELLPAGIKKIADAVASHKKEYKKKLLIKWLAYLQLLWLPPLMKYENCIYAHAGNYHNHVETGSVQFFNKLLKVLHRI